MTKLRWAGLAMMIAAGPLAFAAAAQANAQTASPGDPCSGLHATTRDANGRTMWCEPTMTGANSLFWGYLPPS